MLMAGGPCASRECARFVVSLRLSRLIWSLCSCDIASVTRYKLRHGVWQCWQGVVSWDGEWPTSASGMLTHLQKCVTRSLCCITALYVPLSCARMSLRRVRAVSDFGSPKADRASGSAVGMSPSGTGAFSYLRLCRASRRRWSVRVSVVEGTAVVGASIGGVCDGCH